MAKSGTLTITWVDDSGDFYRNLVATVSKSFPGVSQAGLYQPVHGPSFAFYRQYSISHPRVNAGDKIKVNVSFNHWPGQNPEVTEFVIDDASSPAPTPAPPPTAAKAKAEFKLTVYDKVGGAPFPNLKVSLEFPDGRRNEFTTDNLGAIYMAEPIVTAGPIAVTDINDDSKSPPIRYKDFARPGFPLGTGNKLIIPDKRKVADGVAATHSMTRRTAYGKKKPNYPKMEQDWDYTTVVMHHSGHSGETTADEVEEKHMVTLHQWDDIGYHYLVTKGGAFYEGRHIAFKGSHVELKNTGKIGILVMGDYERAVVNPFPDDPPAVELSAVVALIKTLMKTFPTIVNLGGHKDYKTDTVCPGGKLYDLIGDLRTKTGLGGP